MTPREALEAARERLRDESHWTRHVVARDAEGNNCGPISPRACEWCAMGALLASCNCVDVELRAEAYLIKALPKGYTTIPSLNDSPTTTHADVLALFDRAIALAKADE